MFGLWQVGCTDRAIVRTLPWGGRVLAPSPPQQYEPNPLVEGSTSGPATARSRIRRPRSFATVPGCPGEQQPHGAWRECVAEPGEFTVPPQQRLRRADRRSQRAAMRSRCGGGCRPRGYRLGQGSQLVEGDQREPDPAGDVSDDEEHDLQDADAERVAGPAPRAGLGGEAAGEHEASDRQGAEAEHAVEAVDPSMPSLGGQPEPAGVPGG